MAITKLSNIVETGDMSGEFKLTLKNFATRFNSMVTDNEYKILTNMLGVALYNVYAASPTNTAFVSLRDGESYTDYLDEKSNWQGLDYLLVPYHYSVWIKINP